MQISQLKCIYQNHEEEDIFAVCIEKECNETRPFCFKCLQGGRHKEHNQSILKFPQFYEWRENQAKIIDQINESLGKLDSLTQSLRKLKDDIYNDLFSTQQFLTVNQITQLINNVLKGADFTIELSQINEQINQIKFKIKDLKPQLIKPLVVDYRFSQYYKYKGVLISENGKVAQNQDWKYGFCLCDQAMPQNSEIKFQVKNVTSNLFIGICLREIIQKAKFQSNKSNYNYMQFLSSYLITSNGSIYSQNQKDVSQQQSSFKFSNHDVIIMKADFIQKKITWTKQQSNESFTMEIEEQESEYYPCVWLFRGNKVKIID